MTTNATIRASKAGIPFANFRLMVQPGDNPAAYAALIERTHGNMPDTIFVDSPDPRIRATYTLQNGEWVAETQFTIS